MWFFCPNCCPNFLNYNSVRVHKRHKTWYERHIVHCPHLQQRLKQQNKKKSGINSTESNNLHPIPILPFIFQEKRNCKAHNKHYRVSLTLLQICNIVQRVVLILKVYYTISQFTVTQMTPNSTSPACWHCSSTLRFSSSLHLTVLFAHFSNTGNQEIKLRWTKAKV